MVWKIKLLMVAFLLFATSIFALNFNIGIGKTMISQEGNLFKYSATFSTSFNVSLDYKFKSNYFLETKYTTDTTKLCNFLKEHNFISQYVETYNYKIYSFRMGLDKNNFMYFIGTNIFNSNKRSKVGYDIGVKYYNRIYKNLYYYSEIRYIYVENFIKRVVNTISVELGLRYKMR
ncbi:MAG: hypothetical protein QXJ06_00650 [Candidatus Aenigmatarchaeota archaeon]